MLYLIFFKKNLMKVKVNLLSRLFDHFAEKHFNFQIFLSGAGDQRHSEFVDLLHLNLGQ